MIDILIVAFSGLVVNFILFYMKVLDFQNKYRNHYNDSSITIKVLYKIDLIILLSIPFLYSMHFVSFYNLKKFYYKKYRNKNKKFTDFLDFESRYERRYKNNYIIKNFFRN